MAIYIVTWDFRKNDNYDTKRDKAIKFLSAKGVEVAYTSWAVDYDDNAKKLSEEFMVAVVGPNKKFLNPTADDKTDRVFIGRLWPTPGSQYGWQSKTVWAWFRSKDRSW